MTFLDLLAILARRRSTIMRAAGVVVVLGLIYALVAPEEFQSSSRLVRETSQETPRLPSSLSALGGLGMGLGSLGGGGLSQEAYPSIVHSREVRLAVVRDTFSFPDADEPMTFVEYVARPPGGWGKVLEYTVYLPWTAKRILSNALLSSAADGAASGSAGLTEEEHDALKAIGGMVGTSVDELSGLMTISVHAHGPHLAAALASRFVEELTVRIERIRTKKVRENLSFVQDQFTSAQAKLEEAETRVARFLERNQSISSPLLRAELDRLRRQVRFKEQLYSDLQQQVTSAELELQRQQPVVTIVEAPIPPNQRSAPQRTIILVFSLFLGGGLGVGIALARHTIETSTEQDKDQKLRDIQAAFDPRPILRKLLRRSQ